MRSREIGPKWQHFGDGRSAGRLTMGSRKPTDRTNHPSDGRRRRGADDDEIQETVIVRRPHKGSGGGPPGDFWAGIDDLDTAIDPGGLDEGLELPGPGELPEPPSFNCPAEILTLVGLAVRRDLAYLDSRGCRLAQHGYQGLPDWATKYGGRGEECPDLSRDYTDAQQAVMDQINRICDNCSGAECEQVKGYMRPGSARAGAPVPR